MSISSIDKQTALQKIITALETVGDGAGRAIYWVTALGSMAVISGSSLPPELQPLLGGVGINILSSLIEKIAAGKQVSNKEIQTEVAKAIKVSQMDDLLTDEQFSRALSKLIHNQMRILSTVQGNSAELSQLNDRLSNLTELLYNKYIIKPQQKDFDPFTASERDKYILNKTAGSNFLATTIDYVIRDREPKIGVFGIIMLDIDELTIINKLYGDNVGNDILAAVGRTLRYLLAHDGGMGYTGRCGDDTYYVIRPYWGITNIQQLGETVVEFIQCLPWNKIAANLRVTCSVGIARWKAPEPVRDAIIRATIAMKEAKKHGGNWSEVAPEHISKQQSRKLHDYYS
jgi:diguanylate cyclase (GGDEF)-like protein